MQMLAIGSTARNVIAATAADIPFTRVSAEQQEGPERPKKHGQDGKDPIRPARAATAPVVRHESRAAPANESHVSGPLVRVDSQGLRVGLDYHRRRVDPLRDRDSPGNVAMINHVGINGHNVTLRNGCSYVSVIVPAKPETRNKIMLTKVKPKKSKPSRAALDPVKCERIVQLREGYIKENKPRKAKPAADLSVATLSTQKVAKRLKVVPQAVRNLIAHGRLKASRPGRDWLISEADLRAYLKVRRRPGRPPKAK